MTPMHRKIEIPGVLTLHFPIMQEPDENEEWDEDQAGCSYSQYLRNGRRFR
jgi:hypothetical protein